MRCAELLLCLLLAPVQAAPPPGTSTPLEPNLFGLPIVQVQLERPDGSLQDARMALDTGSAMTILDRALDPALWEPDKDLADADISVKGANGEAVRTESIRIRKIRCGPWVADRPRGIRLDLTSINRFLDEPVCGVMGMNLLEGRSFWLDFRNQVVRWDGPPAGLLRQSLKRGSPETAPRIQVKVSGRPIEAVCDTGFSAFMNLSAEEALSLPAARDSQSRSIQADVIGSGKLASPRILAGPVAFGSRQWCRAEVAVAKSSLLGILAFWPGVWLDFKRNEMGLLASPDGCLDSRPPVKQPLHAFWDRSINPPRLIILGVKPNSRYESAGLQANDVLLEFGDLKGSALNLASLRGAVLGEKARQAVIERQGRRRVIELPETK